MYIYIIDDNCYRINSQNDQPLNNMVYGIPVKYEKIIQLI